MTLRIGRLTALDDATDIAESGSADGLRRLTIEGDEGTSATLTVTAALRRRSDLLGLRGRTEPVTWTEDPSVDGFYRVTGADAGIAALTASTARIEWSVALERVGGASDVEIESRFTSGGLQSTYVLDDSRWHAPPTPYRAYYLGGQSPGTVTRTHSSGAVVDVYRDFLSGYDARFMVPTPGDYYAQAVEIVDVLGGRPFVGVADYVIPATFRLSNGFVEFRLGGTSGDVLPIRFFDGTAWQERNFNVRIDGANVQWGGAVTLLRNDAEEVAVRLYANRTWGRATLDLALQRGSRFVNLFVQNHQAATLRVQRASADASTMIEANALRATASGLKWVMGSSAVTVREPGNGAIEVPNTRTFDAFIGYEPAGATAGNTGDDLVRQYFAGMSEKQTVIRR